MKKFLNFLLVCFVVIIPLMVFVGCNDAPTPPVGPNDPSDPSNSGEVLSLIAGGVTDYRIVIPDPVSKTVQSQAIALRNAIEAVTGVKLSIVNDWEDKDNNADIKEILLGSTNRALSDEAHAQLNGKDYAIVNSGNKLAILGRTDALTELAVTSFLADYVGYRSADDHDQRDTLTIVDNLKMFGTRDIVLYIANQNLGYVDALKTELAKHIDNLKVVTNTDNFATVFSSTRSQLVIVAGVEAVPYEAQDAMMSYLDNKGRVLMLGGPAFEKLFVWNGRPVSLADYRESFINNLDEEDQQILLDTLISSTLSKLQTDSNNKTTITKNLGNYGLSSSTRQLYFAVENLSTWAYMQTSVNVELDQANVLSFYAKAGDNVTSAFTLEIQETNGARWRTKVPITTEWKHCTVIASDFEYRSGEKAGEHPDLSNLALLNFSFETTFLKAAQGPHSFYISDVVLCNAEDDEAFVSTARATTSLNGVAPLYEQYPINNATDISADANQIFVTDRNYVIPTGTNTLVSRHPGIVGTGYDKDTDVRFIPLLAATDAKGLLSGYVAWIDLYATQTKANGNREGSMVGYFGATTDEFYNVDGIAAVVETTLAMTRNIFIVDGGTTEFTYLTNETDTVTAGIKYVTLDSADTEQIKASVSLYHGDKLLAQYTSDDCNSRANHNSIQAIQGNYSLTDKKPDRVVATLSIGDQIIDRVEHDIHYWAPKPVQERSYIYIEDGYFKKDGEIINFFGINYYPFYQGAGLDDKTKTEMNKVTTTYDSFTSNGGYSPEVIINDLKRLKDLGMNAISTQIKAKHAGACNNILDFLRICEQEGFYVDLVLQGCANPLKGYKSNDVETIIRRLHLHENDNIIAYDIAYEERIGTYNGGGGGSLDGRFIGRKQWDDDFTEWTKVQYGSIAAAEQAWGVSLDRTNEGYLLVTDSMLDDTTGKYHKAIAAYYRFIDDIVSTSMEKNLSHLQSTAPDQLISFRMSMSGSTLRTNNFKPSTFCFDFQSLASSMAFMQPEGYEIASTDESALQLMFANAYARYTKPDAPIIMKEYGKTVWPYSVDGNFYPSEGAIANGAAFYRYLLEYCYQSYTSGMFAWYSISGYRVGEDSDYGIINPDGSDRGEITALIREYAPKFINQGERKDTVYITVDRDDYVGGLFGMFDDVKDELAAAYKAGKSVTFIDKSQNADGSYAYADTLLDKYVADAVSLDGKAPLRYVNGIVKSVVNNGDGTAKVTVCNTKQSIWRAGTVSLVSTGGSDFKVDHTFTKDVGYLEDVTFDVAISGNGTIELRLEINGVSFGPIYTTTIQ